MSVLSIALLQMAGCGQDQEANREKGERFCRRAAAMGADIALLPEMWNVAYSGYDAGDRGARAAWQAQAVPTEGAFVQSYRRLANELEMAIAVSYLQEWPAAPRNAVTLFDRHGEAAFTYAKVHTCDFDTPEIACTPGDGWHVAEVDTAAGPVKLGAMICYDREFPESARVLMLQGAEIILTPNACTLEINRLSQYRARAFENMVGVAMTNYAAPQNNGQSVAHAADGSLIVKAGEQEGIYLAPFDLDALRDYRGHEMWGNAFRRPDHYGPLTSMEIDAAFVRKTADGDLYRPEQR